MSIFTPALGLVKPPLAHALAALKFRAARVAPPEPIPSVAELALADRLAHAADGNDPDTYAPGWDFHPLVPTAPMTRDQFLAHGERLVAAALADGYPSPAGDDLRGDRDDIAWLGFRLGYVGCSSVLPPLAFTKDERTRFFVAMYDADFLIDGVDADYSRFLRDRAEAGFAPEPAPRVVPLGPDEPEVDWLLG